MPSGIEQSTTLLWGRGCRAGYLALLLTLLVGCGNHTPPPSPSLPLEALLSESGAGFASVDSVWDYRFPGDHAAHPNFRSEAWLLAGKLVDDAGAVFGFQLALYRIALTPDPPDSPSAWAVNQIYRGQLTLTDPLTGRFIVEERLGRAALGLAGAEDTPPRVWVENLSLRVDADGDWQLQARAGGVDLHLNLRAVKPVITGNPAAGAASNATFYGYLLPRLTVTGELTINDSQHPVQGRAMLERFWGAIPIGQGQQALNRFRLQLDDGRDIILLQLHRRDGSGTPVTTGFLVDTEGDTRQLRRRDLDFSATDYWEAATDARYPVAWDLDLIREGLALRVAPLMEGQRVVTAVNNYWAGSLALEDATGAIIGYGHAELTGYEDIVGSVSDRE